MKRNEFILLLLIVNILLVQTTELKGKEAIDEKIATDIEPIKFDNARKIACYNDYLIIMEVEYGWSVVDISNPKKPGSKTEVNIKANLPSLRMIDNYLYCQYYNHTEHFQEILVYDVTNPLNPLLIGNISYQSYEVIKSWYPTTERFYYITEWDNLYTYDVTDPSNLVLLNKTDYTGIDNILYASNEVMYTVDFEEVEIWDVENLNDPILLKTLSIEDGYPNDMVVVENFGYITLCDSGGYYNYWGIAYFDMTDEKNPINVNHFELDTWESVCLMNSGNSTIYISGYNTYSTYLHLELIAPGEIGGVTRIDTDYNLDFIWDIEYKEGFLYLLNPGRLYIINLNPSGLAINYLFYIGSLSIFCLFLVVRNRRKSK